MHIPFARPTLLVLALLAPTDTRAQAQDPKDLLAKALAKMAGLTGVKFRSVEVQDSAMMRQIAAQMPAGMGGDEDVLVEGTCCQGVLVASAGDAEKVVRYRGRTVASSDGAWKLRADTLPSGTPMPFLFDPQAFFEVLGSAGIAIAHTEEAKRGEAVSVVVSATLEGDAARDLLAAGVFPKISSGGLMLRGPMGMMSGGDHDVTVDVALTIDPASALVHRVRIKAYEDNPMMGQIRIATSDNGVDSEAEVGGGEGDETAKANAKADTYKSGLPVRALSKSLSMVDFDVTLSDHEKSFPVALDDKTKALLKL